MERNITIKLKTGGNMTKLLLALTGYFMAIGTGILVMLFGWGLQPQSWGWIIGGGVFSSLLAAIFQLAD